MIKIIIAIILIVAAGVGVYLFIKSNQTKKPVVEVQVPVLPTPVIPTPIPDIPVKKITISLVAVNENPKIPKDLICTFSTGIKAIVSGLDCVSCAKFEWYDNGVLIPGQTTDYLQNVPVYRFLVNHYITCKAIGEGMEAMSSPVKLV